MKCLFSKDDTGTIWLTYVSDIRTKTKDSQERHIEPHNLYMKTDEEKKYLKQLLSSNIELQSKKVKTLSTMMDMEF